MKYDFCIFAYFSACLAGLFQQGNKTLPIGILGLRVATIGVIATNCGFGAPQHTIRNLITCLDKVGSSACGYHLLQTVLGVPVDGILQLFVSHVFPCIRCPLLARIGPGIAVVEVKYQSHACVLDAFAKCLHIIQVLAHSLVVILCRVYKQTYAHGVQAFLLKECQYIRNRLACFVFVHHVSRFVFG